VEDANHHVLCRGMTSEGCLHNLLRRLQNYELPLNIERLKSYEVAISSGLTPFVLVWLHCSYSLKAHDDVDEDGGDDQMLYGDLSPGARCNDLSTRHLQSATSKVFPAFLRHLRGIDQQMLTALFDAMRSHKRC
jgi:hypothetical protein